MSVDPAVWSELFAPLREGGPWVVGQLGQSVDGRIATASGHSHYINGPGDIERLHRLRALADAVVVGAGTVASDDPRLTVRLCEGEDPVRVVLDPSGRLDSGRTVFQDGAAQTVWLQAQEAPQTADAGQVRAGAQGEDALRAGDVLRPGGAGPGSHVEVVHMTTSAGRFDPHDVVRLLAERGLGRVLVEGGGLTVSGFLQAGALDRLHLSVAPLILGSGRPSLTLLPIETLDEALRPRVRHFTLGSDLLFDLELDRRQG